MELYLHIPFCARKCRYCDFASYAGRESDMASYVDALLTEAAEYDVSAPVDTVFIGGGTPSLLPPHLLDRLLTGVHARFNILPGCEFTTEANPGTLTAEWFSIAVRHGVNRLSLGMQAYQPHLLSMLGRIHDFNQVAHSVRLARAAGVADVSIDLMFGLPGQTCADWRETLSAALSLSPQHLSCYGLIPEDGTPLKAQLDSGELTLPDEDTERVMYEETLSTLASHGFRQYEISNFAQPGHECRHNVGYWTHVPYLGLGCAASSMLPSADPAAKYIRIANPPRLDDYLAMIASRDFTRRETEPISPSDAQFETLMLGLRMTRGVSESDYATLHGESIDRRYGRALRKLVADGLLEHREGCWRLTRRGMDVQNAVLVDLMDA